MCGIVGYAGTEPATAAVWLKDATRRLSHRGPDASGLWLAADGTVGLGHARLAVLDLSPAGTQPMHSADGSLHVVLNGEIYNYRELRTQLRSVGVPFATGTDTEVLLAAYRQWGTACLDHLVGMFAFALHDESRRCMFIARDRAGEKPLFFRTEQHGLVFASELKALLAQPTAPRKLDRTALEFYLAYGHVPSPRCILAGYHKLQPGEALLYEQSTNRISRWRYWELPSPRDESITAEDLTDEYAVLLEAAVRRQLVADVPVGILLSGGLDSSLVTALAARCSSSPVRTFTVSLPGHGRYDEAGYARIVAQHYGTEHTELAAEPASVDVLPLLARQFDEPLADSSMVPTYLVSALIRESATVALGGDGGDELFGGYPHYSWMQWQSRARRYVPAAGRTLMSRAGHALPLGFRGRNHLVAMGDEPSRSMAHVNLYFDATTRARLIGPVSSTPRTPDQSPEFFKMGLRRDGLTEAENSMRADFMTYLADDLLVKVDRASMLVSLEVRAPFLDRALIEFAFGKVPESCKVDGRERKILSRRLGARLLPSSLDLRRKQGFSLPLSAWFRGPWGRFMRSVLTDCPSHLLNPAVVQELFEGQEKGRNNTQRIYALAMLELWRREYDVDTDVADPAAVGLEVA